MMATNSIIIFLVIGGLVVITFLTIRWIRAPKPKTRHLAMTVWAAYGPYDGAGDAEDSLRRAVQAVFGNEGKADHEEWVKGHVENFRKWEEERRFQKAEKLMRNGLLHTAYGNAFTATCNLVQAEALAEVEKGIEWMNKDFLEEGGHRLEAAKQTDGTTQVMYKQIWSDEEIQRKKKEDGEAILNAIGNNLLKDKSKEAQELITFLFIFKNFNFDARLWPFIIFFKKEIN